MPLTSAWSNSIGLVAVICATAGVVHADSYQIVACADEAENSTNCQLTFTETEICMDRLPPPCNGDQFPVLQASIVHPVGYTGPGGTIQIDVCVLDSRLEAVTERAITTWNAGEPEHDGEG